MTGSTEDFDLLVVGGGKAGKTLAMDWARSGRSVAMVERGMIGGTCINVACIPTKALVASARAVRRLRRADELGLASPPPQVSAESLLRHKAGVVDGMVALNHKQFLDSGMDFVLGQARFTAPRTVEVALDGGGTRVLRGAQTVVNTGTRPFVPPIPGLADAGALTSNSLLDLERLPRRLVVVGGGVVGLEFAQMFASFGSEVSLVEAGPRLLPREDEDIARAVAGFLAADGIRVLTGASVASVRRDAGGEVTVALSDGTALTGDDVLVATGREPVTADLGLEAAGVRTDRAGFVVVDEHLATTAPGTWAAGDVAGSPQFTHVSLDDYRILKQNLAGGSRSTRDRLIPYTIFLTPELARVGLTEAQAREAGHQVRVASLPVAAIPRARTMRETEGLWKAVVDARTDRILGVSLLGPEAGEAVTTVQTAMLAGLPSTALRDMIINHPTMTEGLNLLFGALQD
ncbi:FAD-dependent oxidoreductase [Streptacidiphilus sp. ASG 303]|uniref:dihydrolipoyl dehydrogenase family protein n=1 Tax=Streptacidiphilus sp. ASG 303 TaxID=2896847 RepID=UPI001E41554D|nr:FAD-dependent oxidoreductase [Streptacidiphilus sp. ASG 303]MCD0484084.1 FAD-dependent oxidoreductase [Streptacidiphilus sp. ASG 303]